MESITYLGSADISRKDIADLLPDIDYASYVKDLQRSTEATGIYEEINR